MKYSKSEYNKEIRLEAAFFIGQLFYSNNSNQIILISSGGL